MPSQTTKSRDDGALGAPDAVAGATAQADPLAGQQLSDPLTDPLGPATQLYGGAPAVQFTETLNGNPNDIPDNVTTQPDGRVTGDRGTTHATPTLADAQNGPAASAPGGESRETAVNVLHDVGSPISDRTPAASEIYDESTYDAATGPMPGYTHVTSFNGTIGAPIVHPVADNELFIGGGPRSEDIQQSGIGDCYFLATVTSIAARDPGKIVSMMAGDGTGGASVTFWKENEPPEVSMLTALLSPALALLIRMRWKQYEQVVVSANNELAYNRTTASALGTAPADQRAGNGRGGFAIRGAQLIADESPNQQIWWGNINSNAMEVHRRDVYTMARWAPLMEKAFARFTQTYGQYGNINAGGEDTAQGYENINGGWSHQVMGIFYGEDADLNGDNGGGVHQTGMSWAPGADVLATNAAAVNDLLQIQGRGADAASGDTDAPIITATSMNNQLFPRAKASIDHAKADADWANLSAQTKADIESTKTAITTWEGTSSAANRTAIGNAAAQAANPARNADLHAGARSASLKSMLELLADIRNVGTDNSNGQRNIYGDHVYTVMTVNFVSATGEQVPLSMIPAAYRPILFPLVDTTRSTVVLRNPHRQNEPDINADGSPDDGSANDGVFTFNLEQFFRSFTSIESGTFSRTT